MNKELFKDKKIVIGDYNPITSEYSSMIFNNLGIDPIIINTSSDILKSILDGNNYDLIITNNIYRNDMDGKSLLDKLRKIDNFDTPVVVATIDMGKERYYVEDLGFDAYIEKPLDEEKIKLVLEKFFN